MRMWYVFSEHQISFEQEKERDELLKTSLTCDLMYFQNDLRVKIM